MLRKSLRPTPLKLSVAIASALAALTAHVAYAAQNSAPNTPNTITETVISHPAPAAVEIQPSVELIPVTEDDPAEPSVASAEVIEGSPQTELIMRGNAEIRHEGSTVRGDTLTYVQATDTVSAVGNAEVVRGDATVRAPEIVYELDARKGNATNVDYAYGAQNLRGEAAKVEMIDENVTELTEASCTTCKKGDNSWWIEVDRLTLDQYDQSAVGRNAVLKLGGVPVFGSPWFSFPLTNQRKSGFLPPTVGYSKSRGFDLAVPYYFNLAPNYDYTLTPRLMTNRGVMLGNDMRWKTSWFDADFLLDWMPEDNDRDNDKRYAIHGDFSGHVGGLNYAVDYNRVSDDDYLDDFSSNLKENSTDVLAQNYRIGYHASYWDTNVQVNKNQTLNDTDKPYERVPQVSLSGHAANFEGFDISTLVQATRFSHPTKTEGDRLVLHQQISYPFVAPGWFITPKAQYISTFYDIDRPDSYTGSDSPSVNVPVFSVDSGLTFERDVNIFSANMLQTLEPRLFYSYTPYRNQEDVLNFDSSEADFNFSRMFTENTWSGYDRIDEANQISASLTTRFIDQATGLERLRASIGQRHYFSDMHINAEGRRVKRTDSKGDLLASIGARLTRELQADAFLEYAYERKSPERASAGFRWQPRPMSVVGLYYRYNYETDKTDDDYMKQIDLSVQWPITSRLYGLGRVNYSLYDDRWVDAVAGFEYHSDCWTLRMVAQRYVHDDDGFETAYYIQLELNGLGSVGSNPLSMLTSNIRGYQSRTSNPGSYDNY